MVNVMMLVFQELFFALNCKIVLNDFRIKYADLFFVLFNMPLAIFSSNLNQSVLVGTILILNIIYLIILTRNIKISIVIGTMVYIIEVITDHLVDIINLLIQKNLPYLIEFIPLSFFMTLILYLVCRKIREKRLNKQFLLSKNEVFLAAGTLILIGGLIIFTETMQENKLNNIIYNFVILLLITIILITIHFSRIRELRKQFLLTKKETQIKNDNRYINEMEKHYNELRKFRHDYQNILLSLDEYLKTDDISGLKVYYSEAIKPVSSRVLRQKYKLEDLSKIGVKELKSIFFNKLYSAQMVGTEVSFESKNKIDDFCVDTLDLVLAVGIILDNAIEETNGQKNGSIQTGIMNTALEITIIVKNSLRNNDISVWKMKSAGFSTKGANRGLGLNNLTEIINRNDNLMLETMKMDEYFLQKITIGIGEDEE